MTEAYLIDALRANGLKITPQRQLLCRLIASANDHPSAEALHEEALRVMPTLSLKTVYSALGDLAQIGAVRLARFGTENLRVDTEMEPHAHAVCTLCGRLSDLPIGAEALHSLWSAAGRSAFEIEGCEVLYRGRCGMCADKKLAVAVKKGGE